MLDDLQLKETLRKVGDLKAALDEHAIFAISDTQGLIPLFTPGDVTYTADLREPKGSKVVVVEGYVANDWISRDVPDADLRARNSAGNAFRKPPLGH